MLSSCCWTFSFPWGWDFLKDSFLEEFIPQDRLVANCSSVFKSSQVFCGHLPFNKIKGRRCLLSSQGSGMEEDEVVFPKQVGAALSFRCRSSAALDQNQCHPRGRGVQNQT